MKMEAVHVHAAIALPDLLSACCDALVRIVKGCIDHHCRQLDCGCVDIVILFIGEVDLQVGRSCNVSNENHVDTSVMMPAYALAQSTL